MFSAKAVRDNVVFDGVTFTSSHNIRNKFSIFLVK